MAFEIFKEYGASSRSEATLRTSGYLFLSNAILKRQNIDTSGDEIKEGAILLFDEENNKLGIKISGIYDQKANEQRKISKEKSGVAINILPLLRYYGIKKDKKKYTLNVEIQDDMFVIDLSEVKS